jgi:hypothetical protein
MQLSIKQQGVVKGMASALIVSLITISAGVYIDPFSYSSIHDVGGRLEVFGLSLILPTSFLVVSIGRLARFRFLSPEDIDGSALTKGSEHALLLQSLLQNTLEQFVIAFGVYAAWCFLMPLSWLSAIPLSSVLFSLGRALFFKGYRNGAASRAFGFALTFYSTALLFVIMIIYQLWQAMS